MLFPGRDFQFRARWSVAAITGSHASHLQMKNYPGPKKKKHTIFGWLFCKVLSILQCFRFSLFLILLVTVRNGFYYSRKSRRSGYKIYAANPIYYIPYTTYQIYNWIQKRLKEYTHLNSYLSRESLQNKLYTFTLRSFLPLILTGFQILAETKVSPKYDTATTMLNHCDFNKWNTFFSFGMIAWERSEGMTEGKKEKLGSYLSQMTGHRQKERTLDKC